MAARRALRAVAVLALVITVAGGGGTHASGTVIDRDRGVDISWPECPRDVGIPHRMGQAKPLPSATTGFVVLGLTNGPGFHVNPCLDEELAFIRSHRLPVAVYAMTTYPTRADLVRWGKSGPFTYRTALGRLSNAGYQQALFNVATLRSRRIHVPFVWIDIESYCPWCWSRSTAANDAVVVGVIRGYRSAGYRVGFYSTRDMWGAILGRHAPRGFPEWRTAGATRWSRASWMCTHGSFAGGPAVLGQWWTTTKDYDQVCPAFSGSRARRAFFGSA